MLAVKWKKVVTKETVVPLENQPKEDSTSKKAEKQKKKREEEQKRAKAFAKKGTDPKVDGPRREPNVHQQGSNSGGAKPRKRGASVLDESNRGKKRIERRKVQLSPPKAKIDAILAGLQENVSNPVQDWRGGYVKLFGGKDDHARLRQADGSRQQAARSKQRQTAARYRRKRHRRDATGTRYTVTCSQAPVPC